MEGRVGARSPERFRDSTSGNGIVFVPLVWSALTVSVPL
jgi:hypothetical protein